MSRSSILFPWLRSLFQSKKIDITQSKVCDNKNYPWPVTTPPAPADAELPIFEYYLDPLGNKSIIQEIGHCECCDMQRNYMYAGPIYNRYGASTICPWCIDNGRAAEMWDASFQQFSISGPSVSHKVYEIIMKRTPGYTSWQGNNWLFSDTDAMVFIGDAVGEDLLAENNSKKIQVVLNTLNEINDEWTTDNLMSLTQGEQPSVYLFYDRDNDSYHAYQDFS